MWVTSADTEGNHYKNHIFTIHLKEIPEAVNASG
jgi:hypothetical protein